MHILWLVRTTLPQAAAACGLAGASDVSGSWLTGQLAALRACPDLHLTVLCVGKEDADGTADGVHYRVVRDTAAFAPLLQAERLDLVHIWGTEFDPAAVMAEATPISDWQPPIAPEMGARMATSTPTAAATSSPSTMASSPSPRSSAAERNAPGNTPQAPAVGAATTQRMEPLFSMTANARATAMPMVRPESA